MKYSKEPLMELIIDVIKALVRLLPRFAERVEDIQFMVSDKTRCL